MKYSTACNLILIQPLPAPHCAGKQQYMAPSLSIWGTVPRLNLWQISSLFAWIQTTKTVNTNIDFILSCPSGVKASWSVHINWQFEKKNVHQNCQHVTDSAKISEAGSWSIFDQKHPKIEKGLALSLQWKITMSTTIISTWQCKKNQRRDRGQSLIRNIQKLKKDSLYLCSENIEKKHPLSPPQSENWCLLGWRNVKCRTWSHLLQTSLQQRNCVSSFEKTFLFHAALFFTSSSSGLRQFALLNMLLLEFPRGSWSWSNLVNLISRLDFKTSSKKIIESLSPTRNDIWQNKNMGAELEVKKTNLSGWIVCTWATTHVEETCWSWRFFFQRDSAKMWDLALQWAGKLSGLPFTTKIADHDQKLCSCSRVIFLLPTMLQCCAAAKLWDIALHWASKLSWLPLACAEVLKWPHCWSCRCTHNRQSTQFHRLFSFVISYAPTKNTICLNCILQIQKIDIRGLIRQQKCQLRLRHWEICVLLP